MTEVAIERAARAVYLEAVLTGVPWAEASCATRQHCRRVAKAALSAAFRGSNQSDDSIGRGVALLPVLGRVNTDDRPQRRAGAP